MGRSPQGHPVLVQAGSSEAGQQFAARSAEIIFSHKNNMEEAKAFYQSFKSKVAAAGRKIVSISVGIRWKRDPEILVCMSFLVFGTNLYDSKALLQRKTQRCASFILC
ncbi:hypothetical protein [Paenibacillus sp. N3.4]|uniref:hypothetical protein n=1 Tax=Paenibacillus sp. N3.4 TaxID=2603222 RepID=UPI0037C7E104